MLGYAMSRSDLGKGDEMKGRLETGDLGRLDDEGFLYLSGRTKRFAKIAGYRLGLDEIEQELFAVCPVACLDLGEKIAVAHEQELEAALKARVRELAATYKVPSSSFALRKIAPLPRSTMSSAKDWKPGQDAAHRDHRDAGRHHARLAEAVHQTPSGQRSDHPHQGEHAYHAGRRGHAHAKLAGESGNGRGDDPNPSATVNATAVRIATSGGRSWNGPRRTPRTKRHCVS